MDFRILPWLMLLISAFSSLAFGKECTNVISQSHTLRHQMSSHQDHDHDHLNPSEESTWMGLLPRTVGDEEMEREEFDWAALYRRIRRSDGFSSEQESFLKEISLHDVRLDPGSRYGRAQQTNLEYLLMLDVDRLVWSFRKQAGLPAPGRPYGGWEAPKMELRGHFVGHYLSATAKMWASTQNGSIYEKMTAVVDALFECQNKTGTGYLSAFPSSFFDRLESGSYVWAPYYTIHKIIAGLLDQFSLAGNAKALKMATWTADYYANRVKNVIQRYSIERHWMIMNEESGGMNDALYNLYTMTGEQKHLILAHLFDKPCFLGLLAVQSDSIAGFHANAHIPLVIGAQRRYEITGDPLFKDIGVYFMDVVNASHTYATGGTSVDEFWSDPDRLAGTLQTENEESCTTHNMLKVSRNLFRWTRKASYADYYERALTNGVLSVQRGTDPGVMIYMLPLGVGVSKARSFHGWGTQFDSFWCCYGTGIESFSKLGDSIYFEDRSKPSLYIIQYVTSAINWKSGGLVVNQNVQPVSSRDAFMRVELAFSPNDQSAPRSSELNLRIPSWTNSSNARAMLNNEILDIPPSAGNFLSITRNWTSADVLYLQFPIDLRTEKIKDDRRGLGSVQAILYGPYLLAGLTRDEWELNSRNSTSLSDWIKPVPAERDSQLVTLAQESKNRMIVFSRSNFSITMDEAQPEGTEAAMHSSFRAISVKSSTSSDSLIMLEPFDLPGMVVAPLYSDGTLTISSHPGPDATFRLSALPNGTANTATLESFTHPGCFVHGSAGEKVRLVCTPGASATNEARFSFYRGTRTHDPISFIARGVGRNFILEPLINLRDEIYTVYFNIFA